MSRYPPPATPKSQYDNSSIAISNYQRSETARSTPANQSQQQPNKNSPPPDLEQARRIARIQYDELNQWLYKGQGSDAKNTPNRTNPRDKLSKLTRQQFSELSTDVYDELVRRIERGEQDGGEGKGAPFLLSRDDFHPKRNQARQKLATLPRSRFKDLASDVFYELERRYPEFSQPETPPPPRQNYSDPSNKPFPTDNTQRVKHPPSSTSNPPLRSMVNGGGSHGGVPANDVIVPDKSTLVVDATDGFPFETTFTSPPPLAQPLTINSTRSSPDRDRDRPPGTASTERSDSFAYGNSANRRSGSLSSLKYISNKNTKAGPESRSPTRNRSESDRSDYERRISLMQSKIKNLEQELIQTQRLTEMRAQDAERIQELEDELTTWKERCALQRTELRELEEALESQRNANSREMQLAAQEISRLNEQISELEREQRKQRPAAKVNSPTSEVIIERLKGEVKDLLNELRQLQAKHDELATEREADQETIRELEDDVAYNKKRYEAAKTELRNLKRTSALHGVKNFIPSERLPLAENGAIADIHFTAFTLSIDELLQAGRSNGNNEVINAMRTVISAVGAIDEDVQESEETNANPMSFEDGEKLDGLKARINATLSNVITAAKNHVVSMGLSPVSLLDAASSHLSFSMIELVKLVGMRKANAMEIERFENFCSSGHRSDDDSEAGIVLTSAKTSYSHRAPGGAGPNGGIPVKKSIKDRKAEDTVKAVSSPSRTPAPLALKALGIRSDYPTAGQNMHRPVTPPKSPYSNTRELLLQQRTSDAGPGGGAKNSSSLATRGNQKREEMRSPTGFDGSTGSDLRDSASGSSTTNPDKVFDSPPPRRTTQQRGLKSGLLGAASTDATPVDPTGKMSNFGLGISRADDEEREKLKIYLETQTEAIVAYIQALLSAIRGGGGGGALSENLTQIITIVSSIVAMTSDSIPARKRSQTERILADLSENCNRLSEMQGLDSKTGFNKQTKQAMAAASFGVAKALKELNSYIAGDV